MTPRAYNVRYEWTIPTTLRAGDTYGGQVTLTNTGALTWPAASSDGHPVEVCLFLDDQLYAVLPLPNGDVATGDAISLSFAFRPSPVPGPHVLRIEAVHQHVTWFAAQDVPPLIVQLQVEDTPPTATTVAMTRTLAHNLWHFLPTSGIARSRDGRPFPLFVTRAKGCHLIDAEGHEFLDYTSGWGTTVLGYADDRIQRAIADRLDTAPLPPFPDPIEMEVSEMLTQDFPSAEMVVFGKNGSDVCTLAARFARIVTGKRVILSCGYHGWQDFALDYFTFDASGIPERPSRVLWKIRFNDPEDFLAHFARVKDDLAAVMIEPSGPYRSDEEGLAPDVDLEWLRLVTDSARRVGALVIFDEIITGYRYREHSVQKATGIVPDLTCLGKALASGMPLSALLGSAHLFHTAFRRTHYASTFKGEVYSFAAAKAAINIYRSEPIVDHVWRHGEAIRAGLDEACRRHGVPGVCLGPPFRLGLHFNAASAYERRVIRTTYMQELLKQGVTTVTGIMLPTNAHNDASLARLLHAAERAIETIARGRKRGTLARDLEIPLL